MCGIAGFLLPQPRLGLGTEIAEKFAKTIHHRGPDDKGFFVKDGLCLINTRLSIVDLEHGHQPFSNDDESIVVVQNGEIYNHPELKLHLEKRGCRFKTHCDTEVILKSYEEYGTECFSHLNGMFAIAIYDKRRNKLILARDRLGVKPLYLYQKDSCYLFSSEIKTFLEYPEFDSKVSFDSIHHFMKFNYIPQPKTIYSHVEHIKPGHFYEIDLETLKTSKNKYWQVSNKAEILTRSEDDLIEEIDSILSDAVKIRLRADVPAGAFLSGGLDSSLVCAIAKKRHNYSLESFSIGFDDVRFDESKYAREVSQYLDIKNNLKVLGSDISSLWEKVTWFNDQPHGDISFIPTFILSEFAGNAYKMVLTGDGGDELFAGYTKYFELLDNQAGKAYFDHISLIKEDNEFQTLYDESFYRQVEIESPYRLYSQVIEEVSNFDEINKALYLDSTLLLSGNNLVKPDRMGMANSLETRSPFMDYRLFELMYTVPGHYKLQHGKTKYILKKLAEKYLPDEIIHRKKQMFTVPVGEWFKGALHSRILDVINSESFVSRGIFNVSRVNEMLRLHVAGQHDFTRELRAIVNLEMWFELFKPDKG